MLGKQYTVSWSRLKSINYIRSKASNIYYMYTLILPQGKILNVHEIRQGFLKLTKTNIPTRISQINRFILENERKIIQDKKLQYISGTINNKALSQFDSKWRDTVLIKNARFTLCLALSKQFNIKFNYPLNNAWRSQLNAIDVPINQYISRLLLYALEVFRVLSSMLKVIRFLIGSVHYNRDLERYSMANNVKSIYIPYLQKNHVINNKQTETKNLVNWLKQEFYTSDNLMIFHSNPAILNLDDFDRGIFLTYINLDWRWEKSIVKDLYSRLTTLSKCVGYFITKNDKKLILLHSFEIVKAVYLAKNIPKHIFSDVIFDQSFSPLSPLWVESLGSLGFKNILLFYALAAEPSESSGDNFIPGNWRISNWSEIWVIDNVQLNQLRSVIPGNRTRFKTVGVPYWTDSDREFEVKPNSVALFDSLPSDKYFNLSTSMTAGLYSQDFYYYFFNNILEIAKYYDFRIVHKYKRESSSTTSRFYIEILKEINSKYSNFYSTIDPAVSPFRLIKRCTATISQPISTTAMISKMLSVPSAYYSPIGSIKSDDIVLRTTNLLKSTTELDAWFNSLRKVRKNSNG